jgi:hypothetical protein
MGTVFIYLFCIFFLTQFLLLFILYLFVNSISLTFLKSVGFFNCLSTILSNEVLTILTQARVSRILITNVTYPTYVWGIQIINVASPIYVLCAHDTGCKLYYNLRIWFVS